ncbi:hypothetical protein EON65_32145 [archaeon]|nr:MAG: hypothetical protein EON65_32145 [archaeon]
MRRLLTQASASSGSLYLQVPYEDKDAVKALGAKFDANVKKWYVPPNADIKPFYKWQKIYLNVPFQEKNDAKALGASWDMLESKWFVTGGHDLKLFMKWIEGMETSTSTSKAETSTTPERGHSKQTAKVTQYSPDQTVLLLDVDTNGLPTDVRSTYPLYSTLKSYDSARVVMISYQLCNKTTFDPLDSRSFIIKSDGFPIENTMFHGITLEDSLSKGVALTDAVAELGNALHQTNAIVAHNTDFTCNVLKSELFRHGLLDELAMFETKKDVCIMTLTMPLLKLKDKNGNPKKISLKELVKFAVNEDLPTVRNAAAEVELLGKSLRQLVKTGQIEVPV